MIHLPSPTFCLPFSLAGCGALGRIAVLTPFQRKFIYIWDGSYKDTLAERSPVNSD